MRSRTEVKHAVEPSRAIRCSVNSDAQQATTFVNYCYGASQQGCFDLVSSTSALRRSRPQSDSPSLKLRAGERNRRPALIKRIRDLCFLSARGERMTFRVIVARGFGHCEHIEAISYG